jgi:hypothetical protein
MIVLHIWNLICYIAASERYIATIITIRAKLQIKNITIQFQIQHWFLRFESFWNMEETDSSFFLKS